MVKFVEFKNKQNTSIVSEVETVVSPGERVTGRGSEVSALLVRFWVLFGSWIWVCSFLEIHIGSYVSLKVVTVQKHCLMTP